MPAQTITPIKAHLHYDDVVKVWELKVSREETDGSKTIPWIHVLETFATLAQALAFLLTYWAAAPADAGITTTAEAFDIGGFAAEIGSWTKYGHVDAIGPSGGPVEYPGADPGLDPAPTDFGITPP